MGSVERRTRERDETRQLILEAAREMFVERGYEATTMRAIAERIEYTPTAIYHHFLNKEALLAELSAADFRALGAAFQKIGRIADPIERLRRCGQAYVEFGLRHPMQYQFMFMTRKPPEIMSELRSLDPSEGSYAFLRETCADAIATGRLRPQYQNPDEVALMAWSTLHGFLALWIVKQGDDWIQWGDPDATAAQLCDALLQGVLRQPAG
jgi:AcrR family transcriptional regulator